VEPVCCLSVELDCQLGPLAENDPVWLELADVGLAAGSPGQAACKPDPGEPADRELEVLREYLLYMGKGWDIVVYII
jgi:hypothetical protein